MTSYFVNEFMDYVQKLNDSKATYRKQQKFHDTKLSRFSRIFNKTRKFSLLILGYGTS